MMIKVINNYTLTDTTSELAVDYSKTTKDWSDTILTSLLAIFLWVATYFLLKKGFSSTSYIVILAGLVFAYQAVVLTLSGLSRLLQPTRNILAIDKNTNSIKAKQSIFKTKELKLDSVRSIVVSGSKEKLLHSNSRLTRTYCNINALLIDESEITLLTINTNRFLRPSDQKLETELYSTAKKLSTEINNLIGAKYKWTGFVKK